MNLCGTLIDTSKPLVMGILNITPDSFYDGSRSMQQREIVKCAIRHAQQGVDMLDIGGYSTRPNAEHISVQEELRRLDIAFQVIRHELPNMPLSVDTFRAEVVDELYQSYGGFIVNDISGGTIDKKIFRTTAKHKLPYILGHIKGTPQTMSNNAKYNNLINEIITFFIAQLQKARETGIIDIVLDPCFGFAKTIEHNYTLLKNLNYFQILDLPILAGLSRKSMIYKPLNSTPREALIGTATLNFIALQNGAKILRVHDVKEAKETIKLYQLYEKA